MSSEAEIVSRLIGDIYDAALDPALWPQVLQAACGFVPGAASGVFSKDSASRSGGINYAWGDDPRYTQLYFDKYVRSDPFTTAQFFFDIGDVVSIENIMPYDEYRETVIFREWASPQGYVDVLTTATMASLQGGLLLAKATRSTRPPRQS